MDETVFSDKNEIQEIYSEKSVTVDFNSDSKTDLNTKRCSLQSPDHGNSHLDSQQIVKRNFSDIDDDEDGDNDDGKKKKRKDSESNKDVKSTFGSRTLAKSEKNTKPFTSANKNSPTPVKPILAGDKDFSCDSPKSNTNKSFENEADCDETKISENLYSGGLKVPPLKIVIPSQNCSIDTEGNISRNGKASTSRNAALPYVVSTSNDTSERENISQGNSPNESPIKNNIVCNTMEDKSIKLSNEDKSLHRVLRSSHRTGASTVERSSNNSSPQLQSNSPSPASSTTNEVIENKGSLFPNTLTASPILHNSVYDNDNISNLPSPSTSSTSSSKEVPPTTVELHPRKRKIRSKQDESHVKLPPNISSETTAASETHPHDYPFTNCFQMYLNIRKQIEKRHKLLFSIKPRPPQGYGDYLVKKRSYILNKSNNEFQYKVPHSVSPQMKDIYLDQERERRELCLRHTVEKEKLSLNVEQEILRVHTKAARSISYQPAPYSVCTLIKDEEIYNLITPEQEEKDRNARSRFNGRLLLSWLQDVDDKWEKIKVSF